MKEIRIIRIEAADVYYANKCNKEISESLLEKKYLEIMQPNLDLYFLESKSKLHIQKKGDIIRSNVFVLVSFKYTLKLNKDNEQVTKDKNCIKININTIRKHLYLNGFVLNGKTYVRYKRSAGAAKTGTCLFIRKDLEPMMRKWSNAGLDEKNDNFLNNLTSYEAYKALSMSSLITTLDLKPKNILFVKDVKIKLANQPVIKVDVKNENLEATEERCDITNEIFDGEGLLDKSVFDANKLLNNKGMALLRSRFFKCCAFNTNLQKWFEDNNITNIDQLEGITFAEDIKDIVLVASESCLKYLKLCNGEDTKTKISRWCQAVNDDLHKFGVVKVDKPTRFFDGQMVETTYQLINTLELKKKEADEFVYDNVEYIDKISNIKETPEVLRFFLNGESNDNKEEIDDSEEIPYISEETEKYTYSKFNFKNKVCLELLKVCEYIKHTTLFKRYIYESLVDSLYYKLYKGRVLVHGTYCTLCGNPYEFLQYIIKDFNHEKPNSILKKDEIYTNFFNEGEEIVGSRAPHITMGNLLYAKNKKCSEIDKYFNFTKEIVVVDAINNNIQQRLNGCDYDSDSMLVTNDKIIVNCTKRHYEDFKVPYAAFKPKNRKICRFCSNKKENIMQNLIKIDSQISNNIVGTIVNLSQKLNSHLWNEFDKFDSSYDRELYKKIAILSVLSGAEIDSAKRQFEFIPTKVYKKISSFAKKNGYKTPPLFFNAITYDENLKPLKFAKILEINKFASEKNMLEKENNLHFKTGMDRLRAALNINVSYKKMETISFLDLLCEDLDTQGTSGKVYKQVEKALAEISELYGKIKYIKNESRDDFLARQEDFNLLAKSTYLKIHKNINTPLKAKIIIKKLIEDKKHDEDDIIYKERFSKCYLFLYILSCFGENLDYTFETLFFKNSTPCPTLKKTNSNSATHTFFKNYHYKKV